MSLKTKDSVNRPCECGSGLKRKKCHGVIVRLPLPAAAPAEVRDLSAEMARRQRMRLRRFGHARLPVVTSPPDGRRGVAIGRREYLGDWYGVMDAWIPFVRKMFGPAWFDSQRRRPPKDQHILMRWDAELARLRNATPREKDGGKLVRITATVFAYFMFAWDMVLVEENVGLPAKLIKRLKDRLTFQGARHELFAAAILARAGYAVAFEDESDSSVKHTEMIGTHKKCGQKVAVEAKSRHVHGVLDFRSQTGTKGRLEFDSLLRKAFGKPSDFPLVVFLDLNVPPSMYPLRNKGVARKIKREADSRTRTRPSPYNLLIATNFALHYAEGALVFPKKGMFILEASNPRAKPKYPAALKEIAEQARHYGSFTPRRFEDLDARLPIADGTRLR